MARTAETVEAELDALKSARAQGVLRVEFQDQVLVLADGEDLDRRIAALERELARLQGPRRTHHKAAISKGL